jgi:hypothetical protein
MVTHVNQGLMNSDFKAGPSRFGWSMRDSDISAFKGTVRAVTLPPGFRLFKLSAGEAAAHAQYGVTPWWSPVMPYWEDYEGALGRYEQAKLNKIDMSSMVRYMSAVCLDWNDLDNYIEVQIRPGVEISGFWGLFSAQNLFSDGRKISGHHSELLSARVSKPSVASRAAGYKSAVMPDQLGVLDAWQFYIPGLQDDHIIRSSVLNAHDMVTLAMHFGTSLR